MHAVAYILAAVTAAAMLAMVRLRNLVHCVLALALGFLGLAAIYLHLGAQFVGFTQVLVYVGAVSILAVFVIMMTHRPELVEMKEPANASKIAGILIAAGVFGVLASTMYRGSASLPYTSTETPEVPIAQIGNSLMHDYVLPLEIMGVLLTAALIGAVVLAMEHDGEESEK
jgi:NADH-quinone oxidoreductase subunit J